MKSTPALAFALALPQLALSQAATQPARHESLKQEIRLAYDRGLAFLRARQDARTGQIGRAHV